MGFPIVLLEDERCGSLCHLGKKYNKLFEAFALGDGFLLLEETNLYCGGSHKKRVQETGETNQIMPVT